MLKIAITSILLVLAEPLFGAACEKLIPLDDGKGKILGYVIPQDVRALTGDSTSTRILLAGGAGIDISASITSVYARLKQYCPSIGEWFSEGNG
jgi:hypothetical protein